MSAEVPTPSPDTIVAVATAPGEAAMGGTRPSGPRAVESASPPLRFGPAGPVAAIPARAVRRVSVIDPSPDTRLV